MSRFDPTSRQVKFLKEEGVQINDCVKLGRMLNMLSILKKGHVHQQVLQDILIELLEQETVGVTMPELDG